MKTVRIADDIEKTLTIILQNLLSMATVNVKVFKHHKKLMVRI